jgi:hypothetical protein
MAQVTVSNGQDRYWDWFAASFVGDQQGASDFIGRGSIFDRMTSK